MGKVIGEGTQPLICTPLVGRNQEIVLAELAIILEKMPDIIEWRADFFERIANTDEVIALTNAMKKIAGDVPIIFTIRSIREGGQIISLSDREAIELSAAICKNTSVEYVDCELSNLPEHFQKLCKIAKQNSTKVIASFHNFTCTPRKEILEQKFRQAEEYGADVAKVAVMPTSVEDVLTLLSATLEAKKKLKIPVISMSMGGLGALTRMFGGVFGSTVSFAVGENSSAPGQVPIDDLKTVFQIVKKSMGM
ncbi:type I 3-dehydroquinate dehydratase [Pelosinus propionicus]|uniref:3-dehydroquinate dehydratase n=1 Tax=Pelosinus propionicus DSM 13327 TaxID=1123291 RepID=A0A1I4GKX6_9FIRM|nr:type I 3-dehydroquinate dehydratase [Pelosinus propionicus]SFL30702.1 3-dehydroquinate dehydratase [Pelosinus propionicus DSM 13327]